MFGNSVAIVGVSAIVREPFIIVISRLSSGQSSNKALIRCYDNKYSILTFDCLGLLSMQFIIGASFLSWSLGGELLDGQTFWTQRSFVEINVEDLL